MQALPAAVRFASAPSSGTFGSGALGAVAVRAVRTRKDCEVGWEQPAIRLRFKSGSVCCFVRCAQSSVLERELTCLSRRSSKRRSSSCRATSCRVIEQSVPARHEPSSPAIEPPMEQPTSGRATRAPVLISDATLMPERSQAMKATGVQKIDILHGPGGWER